MRVPRLEVFSVNKVYITNQFQNTFERGGGGVKSASRGDCGIERRKTLKTFVLITPKNSASGPNHEWSKAFTLLLILCWLFILSPFFCPWVILIGDKIGCESFKCLKSFYLMLIGYKTTRFTSYGFNRKATFISFLKTVKVPHRKVYIINIRACKFLQYIRNIEISGILPTEKDFVRMHQSLENT